MAAARDELAVEQDYVRRLYTRLDALRDQARERLAEVRGRGASGTPQARSERDAFATMYEDRLAQLNAVEGGLCFGRLDLAEGARHYIGRIGLFDDQHEPLLVDWRAPAAEPFYRATPAQPQGVVRRRHLRTRGRDVVGVDDDVFALESLTETDRGTLSGEAALLAALSEHRTGRMRDIVATIQAEQDKVIRSELSGVLVVQGGPGTGKTAVALHRAAYLLYTHRDRLARSGVLVVGPNAVFTRYIEQVLPSLGETGVRLATLDQLVPGVTAGAPEPEAVATVKGDARMAQVVRNAVTAYQRIPTDDVVVAWEDGDLLLDRQAYSAARRRAQRSRRPHNLARLTFARGLLEELVGQACALLQTTPRESRWVTRSIMRSEEFRAAVDAGWPRLTAQELVADLYAEPARLGAAAPILDPRERGLLRRDRGAAWTPADVPVLDEARVLLGDVETVLEKARERRERERERRYAREVLELTGTAGRVDPETLAARYRGPGGATNVAERAVLDPGWEFGHVIVDEAQELSAMGWRMLARRCPSLSMTVVGDIAQTGSAWGARSWAQMLDPISSGRWRVVQLSVNYRTPAEIMAVAADVLRSVDPSAVPPTSVRDGGSPPWARRVESARLAELLPLLVAEEVAAADGGTVVVLVPADRHDELAAAVAATTPGASGGGPDALDAPVAVLPVGQAKGLEFDRVLVVEPGRILDASAHGGNDLYVALTRATARLGVVHTEELPEALRRIPSAG